MFLVGQASAFQGKSVAASDCGYGGKIKSIEATDRLTVTFSMCKPDPAFLAKAAFTPFGIQPQEHLDSTGGGGEILSSGRLIARIESNNFMLRRVPSSL